MKSGSSRTYELRLGVTEVPAAQGRRRRVRAAERRRFREPRLHRRAPGPGAERPDINRALSVTSGLKGVTHLKAGGPAKEFTATVTNRGNITQEVEAVFEIADKNLNRRMAAGEVRVQRYVDAAASGWRDVKLAPSTWTTGALRAAVAPGTQDLAPGESRTYKLRVSATNAVRTQAFTVSVEAAAERSAARIALPFAVAGVATGTGGAPSATPASPSAVPATSPTTDTAGGGTTATVRSAAADSAATGEMARTGSDTTLPLALGATGVLVAGGAATVLIARRRAL